MPDPKTGRGASAPSPWLTFVAPIAVGLSLALGSHLVGFGREAGGTASELRAVREEQAAVKTALATLATTVTAARAETRTEIQRAVDSVSELSLTTADLRATQREMDRRWSERATSLEAGTREVREVLTRMRDMFIGNGLDQPQVQPPRRRSGSLLSPWPGAELRPATFLHPVRIDLAAP